MFHRIHLSPISDNSQPRNSIGTSVWAPAKKNIPDCANCGRKLLLFFQFSIEKSFALPFEESSHFVLLMCPNCNEIPSFDSSGDEQLENDYWNKVEGHFYTALYNPSSEITIHSHREKLLLPFEMDFLEISDEVHPDEFITIGGEPRWLQDPEHHTCSCGGKMKLICQVPENFSFRKRDDAPEQPDSFSVDDYCLFLGNEIYIFGCVEQCNERAIKIVVQN